MITVVSLGVNEGDVTKNGERAILSGAKVILKTALAKSSLSVINSGVDYTTLDYLYENSRNFETLNKKLAKAVVEEEKNGDVVYCVDGSATEDNSVKLLLKRKNVTVIGGVSKSAHIAQTAKIKSCSYLSLSAYDIADYKRRTLPLIVYDLDSAFIAGDVKLALADLVGEEYEVKFVHGESVKKIKLYELDWQEDYDYSTALVVEDSPLTERTRFDGVDLHDIIVRLRADDGCPWDKVQTHESIRMECLEEAYELVDAINKKDSDKMLEESGDVLLQAFFHTVLEEETGGFNLSDVLSAECNKLIFRHSHIFGVDSASDENAALEVWNNNKMKEKNQTTYSDAVNDVPETFPALLRAQKIAKRMKNGGWNFCDEQKNLVKLNEEINELVLAHKNGDKEGMKAELGDVLMVIVHWALILGVNCEQALLDTVEKVVKRFNAFEGLVLADKKNVKELSDEEWFNYYNKAKESCR